MSNNYTLQAWKYFQLFLNFYDHDTIYKEQLKGKQYAICKKNGI